MDTYYTKLAVGSDEETLLFSGEKLIAVFVGEDHVNDAELAAELFNDVLDSVPFTVVAAEDFPP